MKKVLLILVLLTTTIAFSQAPTFENEVKKISRKIDRITQQQKDSLKMKVKEINLQLDEGKITTEQAEAQKKKAAEYHAKRIEVLVGVEEQKLQELVQAKTDGKILGEDKYFEESTFTIGDRTFQLRYEDEPFYVKEERRERRRKRKWRRRTTTQFVFAWGMNNTVEDHNLSSIGDNYKFWDSRFCELGFTWKYRLSDNPSQAYLKYGFSFLWNNLEPDNNMYHVKQPGDVTTLETYPFETSQSRLRHTQITFPLHLEIDFSKNRYYSDGKVYDRTNKSWRLGLGGFVGFKTGTKQFLDYRGPEGFKIQEKQKSNFNMNYYLYGLSTYIAYRSCGLYVKYDLNPLFRNTDTRNISMGLRFDFD